MFVPKTDGAYANRSWDCLWKQGGAEFISMAWAASPSSVNVSLLRRTDASNANAWVRGGLFLPSLGLIDGIGCHVAVGPDVVKLI